MVLDDRSIPEAAKIPLAPLAGIWFVYLLWSAVWGIPTTWNWWRATLSKVGEGWGCILFANPLTWLILLVAFCTIPLYLGYMWGVFGGAIYLYLKNRRIARGAF